jgi:hypothetical protein
MESHKDYGLGFGLFFPPSVQGTHLARLLLSETLDLGAREGAQQQRSPHVGLQMISGSERSGFGRALAPHPHIRMHPRKLPRHPR